MTEFLQQLLRELMYKQKMTNTSKCQFHYGTPKAMNHFSVLGREQLSEVASAKQNLEDILELRG